MKLTVIEIDPKKKYIMALPEHLDGPQRQGYDKRISDWLSDPYQTILIVYGEVQLVKVSEPE